MPGLAHDVLVQALQDDVKLLPMLLAKLTGRHPPGRLKSVDSVVRFTRSAEVRPDVVYRAGRSWFICEVQNKLDPTKARSWLMAVAALRLDRGQMGDLVVITCSPAVARWAARVAHARGQAGTMLRLSPVVLLLNERRARELLDTEKPELALVAAWAMKSRHGRAAVRIVSRAIELSERLPPPLRDAQRHAIYNVLSDRLRSRLQEAAMHPDRVPETPESRKLRLLLESIGERRGLAEGEKRGLAEGEKRGLADGLAQGKRESLRMILEARGFSLTRAERARVDGCSDVALLDTWLKRAVTAETVAQVLDVPSPPPSRERPKARRAARRTSSAAKP